MTILAVISGYASGRQYGIEHISDPVNPDVHARIELLVRNSEGAPWANVVSTDPRTGFTASSWRDTTTDNDGRPLVRLPQIAAPNVFEADIASRIIVKEFGDYIMNQETADGGEPVIEGDGLVDLLAILSTATRGADGGVILDPSVVD